MWALISPSTLLVLLVFFAVLAGRFGLRLLSRVLGFICLTLVLLIGFFPVGAWLAYPLEHRYAQPVDPDVPDGIIVLGGAWKSQGSAYWEQWELNHAAERDLALLALARRYPEAKLVFTGGSGQLFDQTLKEASFARQLYEDLGLDPARVAFESQSRNTYENALYSKKLVEPRPSESWWLITSAYHMPRSVEVFCAHEWAVTPFPVDHFYEPGVLIPNWALADHLWELERVSREWVGLIVYRVTGKAKPGC